MLSAEQRLLGSLAIRRVGSAETLGELVARVAPQRLVTFARREGLDCLLYAKLKRDRLLDGLPPDLVDDLEERYRRTASAGIRILVLKGMALLDDLYPDPGLRPTGDVDVWVARENLDALIAVLTAVGYAPEPFYPDTYRRGNTIVDIHTHLLGAGRVQTREGIFAAGQRGIPCSANESLPNRRSAIARRKSARQTLNQHTNTPIWKF